MKNTLLLCFILALGCQTPGALTEEEFPLDGRNDLVTSITFQTDQSLVLASLRKSGHVISADDYRAMLNYLEVVVPVLSSMRAEMPNSLQNVPGSRWLEIAKSDEEAAAFVSKVQSAINDVTAEIELPTIEGCSIILRAFGCASELVHHCTGEGPDCILKDPLLLVDFWVCVLTCY